MKIKDIIYENRKKQKLTQEELGNELKVSSKTISNWERGVTYPDILLIPKLCEVLGITPNDFFEVEDILKTDGEIEDNQVHIAKFRKSMIIAIALLFSPLLFYFGSLTQSPFVSQIFTVFVPIGYLYSLTSAVVASINFYKYIENKSYSKKYLVVLKNYNLTYYTIVYVILGLGLIIIINEEIAILLVGLLLSFVYLLSLLLIIRKIKFVYNIREKAKFIIPSMILLLFGIVTGLLQIDNLGYLYLIAIIISTVIFVLSLYNLKHKN